MNTKDKIINSAIKNISIYGYERATMKNIARDSEIKSASIYYFFENKQDLMLSVLKKVLNNHFNAMVSAYELNKNEHPLLIMQSLIEKIAEHHFNNFNERQVYLDLMESRDEIIKKKVTHYLDEYNQWLYEQLSYELNQLYGFSNPKDISNIIDYFLLIGNGIFWGTNIYDKERLDQEVQNGKDLLSFTFRSVVNNKI